MDKETELKKEIDFLYLYPPASMSVISRKEAQLNKINGDFSNG